MGQKVCRRCLYREMGDEEYQEMIGKHISILKPEDRTPSKKYEERLAACKICEKLHAGTCLSCGCYVEIRAAMKPAKCPNRKW